MIFFPFLVSFLFQVVEILFVLLILSLLNYHNLISDSSLAFFQLFFLLFSIFIHSFFLGKKGKKKGYQKGFLYGLLIISFFFLFTLFFSKFHIRNLLYYLLILSTSTFGSMIGISQKKDIKKEKL